jgi:hypothetical protein
MQLIIIEYNRLAEIVVLLSKIKKDIKHLSSFSYYPIEELNILNTDTKINKISIFALIGAAFGFIVTNVFIYWSSIYYYRFNTGGKPFFAFISIVPLSFVVSIFCAALFAIITFIFIKYNKNIEYSTIFNINKYLGNNTTKIIILVELNNNILLQDFSIEYNIDLSNQIKVFI